MNDAMSPTGRLAGFVADATWATLPAEVRGSAIGALVNAIGCMVGGSSHDMAGTARAALLALSASTTATLAGRAERTGLLDAPLLNGLAGAAYSFDDTYSAAMLHAGVPLAAALLAVAESRPMAGETLATAFAAGLEAACRLTRAIAVPPADVEMGWSQTGIVCGIAAALASGRLLGLDADALVGAAGIALLEAGGTRLAHGSMAASLIFGHAAQSGVRSALLAARGFTGPRDAVEGRYGLAAMFSRRAYVGSLTDGLGTRFELLANACKPFPCGIVIHPALDAALRLHARLAGDATAIARVRVCVGSGAMTFAARAHPASPVEAKLSLHHWVAVALLTGRAGLAESGQAWIDDDRARRLRGLIDPVEDAALAFDAAGMTVELRDGRTVEVAIDHCVGSAARPMDDDRIDAKFLAQSVPLLGEARARALLDAVRALPAARDAGAVARLCSPA